MNKTKNKVECYEGILMAFEPLESAKEDVKTAENWLNKPKFFVPWGHSHENNHRYRKSKENKGYLFVHEKGRKVVAKVFALLKYEDILTKGNFEEEILPPKWREAGEYEKWHYFYKVTRVLHKNIPFNRLKNRIGEPLKKVGGMRDLAHVQVKI